MQLLPWRIEHHVQPEVSTGEICSSDTGLAVQHVVECARVQAVTVK